VCARARARDAPLGIFVAPREMGQKSIRSSPMAFHISNQREVNRLEERGDVARSINR